MFFKKRKKRGVLGFSLTQLIGMIFVVAIVLLTLYVMGQYGPTFFTSAKTQGSLKNFKGLVDRINNGLMLEDSIYSVDVNYPFYVSDDYIIVGFSTNEVTDSLKMSVDCGDYEEILKPPVCGELACICLWRDSISDDFKDDGGGGFDNIEECIVLPDVNYIFTYYYEDYAPIIDEEIKKEKDKTKKEALEEKKGVVTHNVIGNRYNYGKFYYYQNWSKSYGSFIIYGECDNHWTDEITKPQRLYIEKFSDPTNEGKTSIFITVKTIETEKRYSLMRAKYVKRNLDEYTSDILVAAYENQYTAVFIHYKSFMNDYPGSLIPNVKLNSVLFNLFVNVTKPSLGLPEEAKDYAYKYLKLMVSNEYFYTDWNEEQQIRADYTLALLTKDENERRKIADDLLFYKEAELKSIIDYDGETLFSKINKMVPQESERRE